MTNKVALANFLSTLAQDIVPPEITETRPGRGGLTRMLAEKILQLEVGNCYKFPEDLVNATTLHRLVKDLNKSKKGRSYHASWVAETKTIYIWRTL
jgi:hypothetical protein